ncbi:acetylornithine deacetylase [Salipiger bermudensis]|uniref:acetylornithine deacetylase n=1 Tax=Salipiger bermudensis TaxID=344736 RepID=UPI001C99E1C7|nr:acetylornithine deacetylase [Salipiger bermudensis]MBY6002863.1 acetylornithine deacetylase [Salipiger bermudensis]
MRVLELLDRLIAFPTVSSESNLALIDWAEAHLEACGFAVTRVPSPCGEKAGLIANRGGAGGVVLSGHTDVVPAAGQAWTRDPFKLTREGDRLFGRGTTDMKGFVACALALAEQPAEGQGPLSLVLSWDEEVGCRGIPHMIPHLEAALGPQALCVVGEPTSLVMATGHKGKAAYRAVSHGEAGHSAMAPQFRNALHGACDLVANLRAEQARLMKDGAQDAGYDVPCSTLHVGKMQGGTALNIVPDRATVDWEIRHLAAETPDEIVPRVMAGLEHIALEQVFAYPGLDTDPDLPALKTLRGLARGLGKVSYGTEAGVFEPTGIPTVVCGPGDMAQGHQPDEFIELDQLAGCMEMLEALVARA